MKKIAFLSAVFAVILLAADAPKLDASGFINDGSPGYEIASTNCVVCHSARLVTQVGYSPESWLASIRWMQKTQGLWSFCDNDGWSIERINAENPKKPVCDAEKNLIAYLAKNYAPAKQTGRRMNLAPSLMPAAPAK